MARLLGLADRVGALGRGRDYPENLPGPESSVRKDQLTRLAAGGIAVLTNREQTLPLDRTRSLALIGRHAVETIDMGGGSAQVKPPYQVSVAEGLSCLLGDKVSVTDGVEVRTRPTPARGGLLANPRTGEPGVAFSLLATDGSVIEERHGPAASTVVGFDDDFDQTVHSMRFSARINADGPIVIGVMGAGAWTLEVAGHALSYTRPCPEPGSLSGLGYSTSRYAQPLLTSNDGSPVVSVAITNTGTRSSREVVQVYLLPAAADQPIRLVGWESVTVAPDETIDVQVHTDNRLWRRWDTASGQWSRLPDGGQLIVARGLGDIRGAIEL